MLRMVKLTQHHPVKTNDPEPPSPELSNPSSHPKPPTTNPKSFARKFFILGFLLLPVIPWTLCIAITKFKPATKGDQYWAFLCMVALFVVLTSAGGAVLMLGVELGWFRRVAV